MQVSLPDYRTYVMEQVLYICPHKDCVQSNIKLYSCKDCPFKKEG
jgi:hypothetical protein